MKATIFLILTSISFMCSSQPLENHTWENRVLLIISNESFNDLYVQQVEEIEKSLDGFIDRKLILYKVFPNGYKYSNFLNTVPSKWEKKPNLFSYYNRENHSFKVVLIGLDGSIKDARTSLLSSQELFSIIDGMSMRKAELRGR